MRLGDFQSKPVLKRRTSTQPIFNITNASIERDLSKAETTNKMLVEQLNTSQADYYALEAAHSRIRILLDEARHNAEQASAETLRLSLTIDRLAPLENNVAELSRRLRELESNIVNLESERQALQEQTIQRSREAVAAQTDLASLRTDYVDAQTELVKAQQRISAQEDIQDVLKAQLEELHNNIEPFQIKLHEAETKLTTEQQLRDDLALKVKSLTEILTEAYEQLQVNSLELKKLGDESLSSTSVIGTLTQERDSFKSQEFTLRNQYNILVSKEEVEQKSLAEAQMRIRALEVSLAKATSVTMEKQAVILKLYDDTKSNNKVSTGRTDFKIPLLKENLRLKNLGTRMPTLLKFKAAPERSNDDDNK